MIILIIQCGTKMDYTMCMFIMNIILMSINILKKKIKLDWQKLKIKSIKDRK